MKSYFKGFLLLFIISVFSIQNSYACHALALANINQQVVGPTSIFVNAASTAPTCGCGVYWLDVEVRCLNEAFDGVPFDPTVYLGLNTYPYFQSATMLKPACILQNYPGVNIPFATLCPGLTYQYRMRENNNGNAGPWSVAQNFTVPGATLPLVAAASASNTTICAGDCVNLSSLVAQGCSLSATYTWDNGIGAVQNPAGICPAVTTTYCVTIVEACSNFQDQACVTVSVVPPPVNGTAAVTPTTFCGTANPVLTIAGHQGLIQWQSAPGAGGPWTNIVGGTTTPFNPPATSATTCYQAVITGCGAFVFTSNVVCVTLVVPSPPTMAFTNETCDALDDGTATATPVAMTAPITYSWNTVPVQNTQTATGLPPGTYTVTVSDANGCIETNTVTIGSGPLIVAGFTPPANQCLTGNSFTFNNTGTGPGGGTTYGWDFGDASGTSTAQNPTYTYTGAGTYTVTQTVTQGPCVDVFVSNVTVYPMPLPTGTTTPVLCNGGSTGTANVSAPGYASYQWDAAAGNQITNPASNLAAGSYTVIVTDANGCTGQVTLVVTEPTLLTATAVNIPPSCNGFSDGTATATGLNGSPGYTYSWNSIPVQNTQTATGLGAGTYTATVTDANGCTTTVSATLLDPAGLVLNPTMTAANCGQPDGSTNVTVTSGGSGNFSYSWDTAPVQNTQATVNVPAGTYTITVTDNITGCTETATITVTTTAGITATATFIQDALCNGSSDGQASAAPTGGTGPYTYSWNTVPVQTGSTVTTGAGTYTVVITDGNGCTGNDVVTINEPTPVVASVPASTNSSCFGADDGDATAAGAGGTPGYTYSWNTVPVQNTITATGLAPGNYIVTVTDLNGCLSTSPITILDGPLMSSTVTGVNVSCFGGNDGSADLTPLGGTGPYTYNWTPSGSGAEDPNGLQAGTHFVTITSQEGCTVNDTIIITEPTAVIAVVDSSFDVICNGGADGLAFASAFGGTPGYTYSWNSAPVQNTANATGLPFGVYTVTVTDANGCTATANANINEPAALVATSGSFDAYCAVDQGTVWISPTNGTGPYLHTWDSAGTVIGNLDTLTNLYPGDYNVQLVDANGCIFNTTVTVNPAPGGTASISAFTDVSCFGGNDGTATVSVGGAFPGFSYQWDASAGSQTTNPATGLGLGLYNVTVTDTFGCVMTTNVNISEPTALTVIFTGADNICPDSCNATINAGTAGGTFPYFFQWNDPNLQIAGNAVNLCTGTYTVTITDANGCILIDSSSVVEPPPMILNPTATPASCNQSDGSVTVVVTANGTAPFTYSWDDGLGVVGTTSIINNLPAGTYFATVTDANGCPVTDTVTIANLSGPSMTVDSVYHVQCFGGNDGYAEVQVTGGLFPYTYSWNTAPVQTTPSASNLPAGSYVVTATDSNGCVVTTAINITEPTQIQLTTGGVDPSCFTYNDGTTWVNAIGGVTPYSYTWNSAPAQNTDTATALTAGTYTVTVVDSNGCFDTASVILIDPLLFSVNITGNNVTCFNACDGNALANLTNGIAPFTYAWDDPSAQSNDSIFGLCDDSVNVVVTDAMGCIAYGYIVITEPALLVVTENTHGDVSCNGGNDGFSSVNIVGGTGPYTFDWDLSGTSVSTLQAANNLIAGSYLVTVTDANGCTDQINIIITEPNPLAVVATPVDADCFGANTGSASVSVLGGTAPYSYQWTDGALQQTDTAFSLIAGSYDVTVTDTLGCVFTITGIIINEPTQIVLASSTVSSTCGSANGSASVVVGGGTPTYTYAWNTVPAQATATAGSIVAGNYIVIVTDANGCMDSTTANVIDLGSPTITIPTSTNVSCNGANDGTAQSNTVGGTPGYTYSWNTGNPGDTLANVTGLAGQIYSVTVTDNNGCTASASITIVENSGLSAVINASTNVSCFSLADGDASVIAAGGAGGTYTYSWNTAPVQTTAIATGLIAGSYIATVTDSNGCTAADTILITEPALLTVTLDSLSDVLCNGGNTGYINVIANGGTLGYSYAWLPNISAGPTAAGLIAGNYGVIITDANGCTAANSYDVFEPAQLVVDTVTIPSTCGQLNGSATISIVTGSTPGYTYAWNDPNNQNTATATGLANSNYVVTVTDANGCFVTQNVTVTDLPGPIIDSVIVTPSLCNGQNNGTANVFTSGNAPFTYQWDDPFLQTNQMATGLSASPPLYTVVVTDANGCTSIAVAQIAQPNPLTPVINAPDTICYGEVVQLFANANGGTLPYNFLWGGGQLGQGPIIENPATSTVYTVDVQDPNGCQASTTHTVIVRAQPAFTVADVTICQGDVATLTPANLTGGDPSNPFSFFWMEADSTTNPNTYSPTGVSNPTNTLSVSPAGTIDYIVWVDNVCSTSDTIGVTVNVNDTALGQLVPVIAECQGTVQNFALTTDIGISFGWDFDSDGIIEFTTSTTTTQYVYPAAGTYDITVTLTTAQGCVSTITGIGIATVNPNPIADFTTDPNPPEVTLIDPTFDFIDQSMGADFWNWNFGDFGDLTSDTTQNPQHAYLDTGYYNVQLIVTNIFGCTDTIDKFVRVRPDFLFVIPNSFTPGDGNGINDFFFPGTLVGAIDDNYNFFIFDRWGELVFEGHQLKEGWDGTYKGKLVQNGVFVWKIEVSDMEGTIHNYIGHVNVLR
jgi:gliding motility-associated-like protein